MKLQRPIRWGAFGAATAVALASTLTTSPASAAPGDYSFASAQFLQGSLLGQDLAQLVDLAGEQAERDGTATDGPHSGDLDLTLLGAIPLDIPGGIQLQLSQVEAGVLGQYAYADANGTSIAATGAITEDGAIGTGLEPSDDFGALALDLHGALVGLGAPSGVLDDVTVLDLRIDGVSARATQAAPAAATGAYSIDDVELVLQSQALSQFTTLLEGAVMGQVATLTTQLNNDALGLINDALAQLPSEVASISIGITGTETIATAISSLTTLTGPGVRVDLTTGTITLDIDELVQLNGRAPNTEVLTPEVLGAALAQALTLVNGVVSNVSTAIGGLGIDIDIQIVGQQLIDLNTTLGTLLGSGLAQLLAPLVPAPITDVIDQVVAEIGAPLNLLLNAGLINITSGLPALVTPLLAPLTPVFDAVNDVVSLTVNVQEPTPSVATQAFTQRALRVEVLPAVGALHLDLANVTVGPNQAANPPGGPCVITVASISPTSGPTLGGTLVTITGTDFENATGVSFGGTPALEFSAINDTTIEAVAPAHSAGQVTVTVSGAGCASGTIGYEYVGDPDDNPEGVPGSSTTLPPPAPGDPTPATLPATGSDSAGGTALVAGLLLLAGAGLVLVTRRRAAA